ncbi:hypothetical protein BS78_06G232500 [Paspalum vaginatum]|nr:hypothetical protein BS78_06G232500 [Paspalum vaginatum]
MPRHEPRKATTTEIHLFTFHCGTVPQILGPTEQSQRTHFKRPVAIEPSPSCFPASTSASAFAPRSSPPLIPLLISRLVNSRVSRRPPGSSSASQAPLKLRIARPRSAHSLFPLRRHRHHDDELLCLGLEPPPPIR